MVSKLASDADILKRIEDFCKARSLGVTTFGRLAIGDSNLVANLRSGRSLTLKTAHAIIKWMESDERALDHPERTSQTGRAA